MHLRFSALASFCFVAAAAAQDLPNAREWQRAVASLPLDAHAAAAALNQKYRSSGLPLSYWVQEDSAEQWFDHPPVGVEMHEHPCGAVAFIKLRTIPPKTSLFQGEDAIELDSAGVELRRWGIPVDHTVVGVGADTLMLSLHAGTRVDLALAVTTAGRYAVIPASSQRPTVTTCPPGKPFGESVYARCVEFGAPHRRIIAYQGPCT